MRFEIGLGPLFALLISQSVGAQSHPPPLDTLRAQAKALAGCYQFSWPDSIPALPTLLPRSLELRPVLEGALGYHRLGSFEVRPAEMRNRYRVWKPRGADSLEIELMASATLLPQDILLLGRVVHDTLRGQIIQIDILPDTSHDFPKFRSSVRGRFIATKATCRRRGAA